MKETTALGAALAGAMGTGLFKNLSDFKPVSGHTTFEPRTNDQGACISMLNLIYN